VDTAESDNEDFYYSFELLIDSSLITVTFPLFRYHSGQ